MAIDKNYHPVVRELMGAIKSANPTMPEEASAIMANYKLVSMVSNLRVKIDYNKSMGLAPINFYGICLMDSGVGKTSSLSTLDLWYFKAVKDRLKGLYNKAKKGYIEELRNSDLEDDEIGEAISALSQWTFSISSGTKEGIAKLAQTLFKIKALTVGIEIDELDKYITAEADLMNSLFKAYDVGEWNPKVTAGKQLEDSVYGVAPNFFGLATPDAMLLNGDVADPFRNILASGFARRTFFYYEDSDKLPYIPTEDDYMKLEDEAIKLRENATTLAETFKNMLNRDNLERVISFPTKAKKYIYRYRSESVEKASQTQDPIMNAEYRERHFKVAKLAGAYAFIDGRDEVTTKDIDYAIHLTEHSSASLQRIGDSKSLVERLYLRVRSEEGFVHTQDMLNFGLVSKNQTTKIKEYAEELETYADVYGDIFEVMRDNNNKISAVRITQLITTNSESCIFSASMPRRNGEYNHDSGYKKVEIDFNNIAEWVTQEKKVCYSPIGFKDGKRNNASTEAYSNLIVMDIDEGMSIDYAKEIFKDYYAIITTTRNHQKEKNGVVSDRFRVILLANKYIYTTPKKYKQLMENIQQFYDFSMDTACFDKAHIYYSNPSDVWIGNCEKKLEVSKLIPSDEDHISKKIAKEPIQSFRPDSGKALKMYFEQKAKDAGNAGTGIINILSTAMLATKDKMENVFKTVDNAEEWIGELADYAPDSYWDKHDLEQEVLVGLRKRWDN
jgi:hypothetical protein